MVIVFIPFKDRVGSRPLPNGRTSQVPAVLHLLTLRRLFDHAGAVQRARARCKGQQRAYDSWEIHRFPKGLTMELETGHSGDPEKKRLWNEIMFLGSWGVQISLQQCFSLQSYGRTPYPLWFLCFGGYTSLQFTPIFNSCWHVYI